MNEEIMQGIIETQKQQTTTIKELLEICTILKDRVEALERRGVYEAE